METKLLSEGILIGQLAVAITFLILVFKISRKDQKQSIPREIKESEKKQSLKVETQNKLLLDQETKLIADNKRIQQEFENLTKNNAQLQGELLKYKKVSDTYTTEISRLKKENVRLITSLKNKESVLSENEKKRLVALEVQNKSLKDEENRLRADSGMLRKELENISRNKSQLNEELLERKRASAVDAIEIDRLKKENAKLAASLKEIEVIKPKEELVPPPKLTEEKKEVAPKPARVEEEKHPTRQYQLSREQKKKKLGEILLEQGLVTKEALDKALVYQEKTGYNLSQYLLAYGHIDQAQLAQCLCTQFSIPYIPLRSYNIPDEIIKLVPVDVAEKYWLIPVERTGNFLMVAMADPFDSKAIEKVEEVTGCIVQPLVSILSEIMDALEAYYKIVIKEKDSQGRIVAPFFVDTEAYKGPERRDSIRFKAAVDICYPVEGLYKTSKTKDVSKSGFLFESNIVLGIGALITLQINLPKNITPLPIAAIVQVIRITALKNNNFNIGVKTIKISKQEMELILDYAASLDTEKGA